MYFRIFYKILSNLIRIKKSVKMKMLILGLLALVNADCASDNTWGEGTFEVLTIPYCSRGIAHCAMHIIGYCLITVQLSASFHVESVKVAHCAMELPVLVQNAKLVGQVVTATKLFAMPKHVVGTASALLLIFADVPKNIQDFSLTIQMVILQRYCLY